MRESLERIPVTVIILTQDEESNISECIGTLSAFSEVIVVDSGSTDSTLQILQKEHPDVGVFYHRFQDFGDQRNWCIDNTGTSNEWILFFDADERCTKELAAEINQVVNSEPLEVGYYLTYRNYFLGRWIKHCTLFPTWQLRMFRRGTVEFRKEGHGQREVADGRLGYLKSPYNHYGFSKGVHHWISRHNDYASNETELIWKLRAAPLKPSDCFRGQVERRRFFKRLVSHLGITRSFARFFYLYFLRKGFLDGKAGLLYCLLFFAYEIHLATKLEERRSA